MEEVEREFFEIKAETVELLEEEKAIVHYISTPDIDRGGDVVDPKGMDDKDFAKSPSVWYNHEYMWNPHAKPIGKSAWRKKKDEGVLAKTVFSKTSIEADDIYNLHKEGIIGSWSIGFTVPEGGIEHDVKKNITYINKWKLFEYSSAPLAMNPNALDQMKSVVKSEQFKNLVDVYSIKNEVELNIADFKKQIEEILEIKKQVEERLKVDNNEKIDMLEKEILSLTSLINKKLTESVETLGYDRAKAIISGEVSRLTNNKK